MIVTMMKRRGKVLSRWSSLLTHPLNIVTTKLGLLREKVGRALIGKEIFRGGIVFTTYWSSGSTYNIEKYIQQISFQDYGHPLLFNIHIHIQTQIEMQRRKQERHSPESLLIEWKIRKGGDEESIGKGRKVPSDTVQRRIPRRLTLFTNNPQWRRLGSSSLFT